MTAQWFFMALIIALKEAIRLFLGLTPYIILGVIISEYLRYTSWSEFVRQNISKSLPMSIFMSIILGIISPLCTFGTIPIIISLYKHKVRLSPLISFLAASSLMNPQLFILLSGGLGIKFALISLSIALLFSTLIGIAAIKIPDNFAVREIHKTDEVSENKPSNKKVWNFKVYVSKCRKQLLFISKYVLIGALLGSVIETFIPKQYVLSFFSESTTGTILFAAVAGIPLYACGGGAIPVMQTMLGQGMTIGAAVAFMAVGQGTRLSPMMALATFFKPQFLAVYALLLVLFSTFVGLLI